MGRGRPGEALVYAGTDFIIARDGRIAAIYLFLTSYPERQASFVVLYRSRAEGHRNLRAAPWRPLSIDHRERDPRNLTEGPAVRLEPSHGPHALDRRDKELR